MSWFGPPKWALRLAVRQDAVERRNNAFERKITRIGRRILSNQDQLNARVDKLAKVVDDIEAEVAKLKAQPAAENLDFTALDALISRVDEDVPEPAVDTPPVV